MLHVFILLFVTREYLLISKELLRAFRIVQGFQPKKIHSHAGVKPQSCVKIMSYILTDTQLCKINEKMIKIKVNKKQV